MNGDADEAAREVQESPQGASGKGAGRRRMRYPRPLIFINLPKAAGSTLQEIIARQYRWGQGFVFTGDPARLKQFTEMSPEERGRYDMLHGHVHFGIHRWLPEPATYATMLRDPVERIASHYYFVRETPTHYMHGRLHAEDWTLEQYATLGVNIELDNDQVRWLTEAEHHDVPHGRVSRDMLEEAKWNLEHAFSVFGLVERFEEAKWNLEHAFSVFGLVERFEDSLDCLRAAFGWEDMVCERVKNVNTERPRTPLPRTTVEAIRQANRWDVELYEFACGLFERQMVRLGVPPRPVAAPGDRANHLATELQQPPRIVVSARELSHLNGKRTV